MVRGVSRQIIEVPDTGNIYYEKAYLVVKPEFSDAQRTLLEKEAKRVLRAMDAPFISDVYFYYIIISYHNKHCNFLSHCLIFFLFSQNVLI